MTEKEIGLLILTLGVFIAVVHTLGYIFDAGRHPARRLAAIAASDA